jgi:hypothetical protein
MRIAEPAPPATPMISAALGLPRTVMTPIGGNPGDPLNFEGSFRRRSSTKLGDDLDL